MGVYLFTGADESLVRSAVQDLLRQLVGDGDMSLMVDEFDDDQYEIGAVVDAAHTPPFLAERRIVVARAIGRFSAEVIAPLVDYLADASPTTELVLVGGGGKVASSLPAAVTAAGGIVKSVSAGGRSKDHNEWIGERAAELGVAFDARSRSMIADWLGADLGRFDGIVATLVSIHGTGVRFGVADVEPFLGESGSLPTYQLTDALDAGRTSEALGYLHRMLGGGGFHPLQVMAVLHNHYVKLARLDGAEAHDEASAARILGQKGGFPVTKLMAASRQLGSDSVRRALELLAAADLDLRGSTDLEAETVLEILVARLSRLRPMSRR